LYGDERAEMSGWNKKKLIEKGNKKIHLKRKRKKNGPGWH